MHTCELFYDYKSGEKPRIVVWDFSLFFTGKAEKVFFFFSFTAYNDSSGPRSGNYRKPPWVKVNIISWRILPPLCVSFGQ